VIGLGVEALLFSLWRLHPGCCCRVGPVRDLHDVPRDAIEIAGVINAAGAQLSPDRHTKQGGEELSGF
jgi:hypothetical protein